ncbi:hypothetical protein TNCV_67901 [Trichonephila clavipes]|nr:hypothetical protein TNCV_67901 [Trichonephila clavipes]
MYHPPDLKSLSTDLQDLFTVGTISLASHACSHPQVPRAHHAGFSRRTLAGVGLYESVRRYGPGLVLLTNGGMQQQVLFGFFFFHSSYPNLLSKTSKKKIEEKYS